MYVCTGGEREGLLPSSPGYPLQWRKAGYDARGFLTITGGGEGGG